MTPTTTELFDLTTAIQDIAQTCKLAPGSVRGATDLILEGNTIPFIARYRKERTGGLDESELRSVEDLLTHARELAERKDTILKTIEEQGKLDGGLKARILACKDRKDLEELYLPYKPRRRTRATQARERGLEPLAELLRKQEAAGSANAILAPFIDPSKEVPDVEAALRGACDILAEEWAEELEIREITRQEMQRGQLVCKVKRGWKGKPSKFETYYDYREPLRRVPSHRYLAIRRGEAEGILQASVEFEEQNVVRRLGGRVLRSPKFLFRKHLEAAVADCCTRLLFPSVASSILADLKENSDTEAIAVFTRNLRELLLAPPAGARAVIGIDPGFRTGCKVAVVDATGRFLEHATIFPTPPRNDTQGATSKLVELIERHDAKLIAIGNGTGSRETDAFVGTLLRDRKSDVAKVTVSESGASIYSASDAARAEFPDLDLTVRGAISIARRLQDPLAELVKVDPKTIGVGQYQHDVQQAKLRTALDREVESCVNRVGVEVNTASAWLLAYVAGIGPKLGEAIVKQRDAKGAFASRKDLLAVPRLGAKAMEQAAGFLRIRDGAEPLDSSAVHPESYRIVHAMAKALELRPERLIGNREALSRLDPKNFVDENAGLPTVSDILAELEKPGRDPRAEFQVARFSDAVHELSDLRPGLLLEGVVTNVTRFGAFVDIGVHQDGLVHISELDQKYVDDPSDVVAVGDIVKVKVLEVDVERKRIALSRKQAP